MCLGRQITSRFNTRGRGSILLRSPSCDNNVPACATILRDNMSLTASLIKPEQRTSYVLVCSQSFVSQLQGLLTLATSLFPEARVWAGKGGGGNEHKKKERTPRLALSLLLSLFFLRLPVLRVLFPKGPQSFPLAEPISAYRHHYILLVPDIPLLR